MVVVAREDEGRVRTVRRAKRSLLEPASCQAAKSPVAQPVALRESGRLGVVLQPVLGVLRLLDSEDSVCRTEREERLMSNGTTVAVLCAAPAALLFVVAWREAAVVRRLRRDGIHTRGVVVDNTQVADDDGQIWVPVVAFHDQQGHRVEFSPRMRGTRMGLETGREVPVVYEGRHPQTARVHMWRYMMGTAVSLLLGGMAFLGAAVLIVLTK
ncbi:DUF3592 domain-containing protein [Streptomyces sp. NPDC001393]